MARRSKVRPLVKTVLMIRFLFASLLLQSATGFVLYRKNTGDSARNRPLQTSSGDETDVSDLGLTMDDLNAPLPPDLLGVSTCGYDSTSRIPDTGDSGCAWEEEEFAVKVVLTIPGLRGQPPTCLAVEVSETTATVTAFGLVVWSCILRGECLPSTASFSVEDGEDMVPVIHLSVEKAATTDRWGGFIAQIGEDSIL